MSGELSFAAAVKEELCRKLPSRKSEILAEAYGILLFCSRFNNEEIRIITTSAEFANRVPQILKRAFGVTFNQVPALGKNGRLTFHLTDETQLKTVLDACGYDPYASVTLHLNYGMAEDDAARAALLRGAFLAGGFVNDPEKAYHLELATTHYQVSREVLTLMDDCGLPAKSGTRKGNYLTYLKKNDLIADFLTLIGAPGAGMKVISAKVDKTVITRANSLSNCDVANVDKQITAAQVQLAAIRRIRESGDFADLPDKLREAALLREENPELSIAQLSELCSPPVSKPAFSYRLRRLGEIAEHLS